MTPFQRFIVHLSSSMLLNENSGDTLDDIEQLFKLADMAMPEMVEGHPHDRLAELLGIDSDDDMGLYTKDVARIAADLRMHDPGPFDGQATAALSEQPAVWRLAKVEPYAEEDERGGSWHATFVRGLHSVTFIVVGIKAALRTASEMSDPYTWASWTNPNGGSSHRAGQVYAARIDGSYCPDVVISLLGAGLRNGKINHVSPYAES